MAGRGGARVVRFALAAELVDLAGGTGAAALPPATVRALAAALSEEGRERVWCQVAERDGHPDGWVAYSAMVSTWNAGYFLDIQHLAARDRATAAALLRGVREHAGTLGAVTVRWQSTGAADDALAPLLEGPSGVSTLTKTRYTIAARVPTPSGARADNG